MRRETDEVVRGFLALNALLREELRDIRRLFAARASETKYNPNWRLQPRAPVGTPKGGQWINGGKQAQQRPAARPPQPPRPAPAPTPSRVPTHRPQIAPSRPGHIARPGPTPDTTSLPLRLFRVSPLTLALPLSGDTPRPTVTTRLVNGTIDLLLVEIDNHDGRGAHASFQRIVRPALRTPITILGQETLFRDTAPAELERLDVGVTISGGDVVFDPRDLASAYGRDLPGITTAETPVIAPQTAEEHLLAHNLRNLGADTWTINAAIQNLRNEQSDEALATALRRRGVSDANLRRIMDALRLARASHAPTILDLFPEIASARPGTIVNARQGGIQRSWGEVVESRYSTRALADGILLEIYSIDPNYAIEAPTDADLATPDTRSAYLNRLSAMRAAVHFREYGDVTLLQAETALFLQARVDQAYAEAERLYGARRLRVRLSRGEAVGNSMDRQVHRALPEFYANLGVDLGGQVRVNQREYNRSDETYRIPDARVGPTHIDWTIRRKGPRNKQIVGFFMSDSAPTLVLIFRPSQLGDNSSYAITRPRD